MQISIFQQEPLKWGDDMWYVEEGAVRLSVSGEASLLSKPHVKAAATQREQTEDPT